MKLDSGRDTAMIAAVVGERTRMDRIVVFLNGDRGEAVLAALTEAGHGVVSVIRGHRDVNAAGFVADLAELRPNLLVVAGYSAIFRAPLLRVAVHGAINLHAGRLTQSRARLAIDHLPVQRRAAAVLSIIQMDEGIDTGPVWLASQLPIGSRDIIMDLHARANRLFPPMTVEVVSMIERGKRAVPQQEDGACYWHQRSAADSWLDFRAVTAAEADRFIRALTGKYGGAKCRNGDAVVTLWTARLPGRSICGSPGRVCWIEKTGPYIVCRDRAILIEEHAGPLAHGDVLS
jgi:methionyl-tRNA formyltransferase